MDVTFSQKKLYWKYGLFRKLYFRSRPVCILWWKNCAVSMICGTWPSMFCWFGFGLFWFFCCCWVFEHTIYFFFYFYKLQHKIQSKTPKFSILISHSFMMYSWADNLIAYGFSFFMSKIGICLIQTFWRFLSHSSRLQVCIWSLTLANDCIKDRSDVFQYTVCTKGQSYWTASGKCHNCKAENMKITEPEKPKNSHLFALGQDQCTYKHP